MKLKSANHSHYPKIGETDEQHKLRQAYHLFDRKKISTFQVVKVQQDVTREAIEEQEKAHLDVVTDGLILWNDPISHIMKNLEGAKIGGLLRFFDTNFYFRQPEITGPILRKSSLLKEEAAFLKRHTAKGETKVVLTGPYTLAVLSKISTPAYKTSREVAQALAQVLAEEIKDLADSGINHIQIDEPGFFLQRPDWKWLSGLFEKLCSQKGKAKIWLTTYFGDVAPLYARLQELPVDVLGVDVTYSPTLLDLIRKEGSQKDLALGFLDGRNTKLENLKEVVHELKSLEKKVAQDKTVYVTTSCGLEYLPQDKAIKKLKLLEEINHAYSR